MDFLKELLALKEQEAEVKVADLKVDDQVHGQLEKAAKEDEVETQCFGLEMEDGKVVKVYVKQEDAEAFEEAMSGRLGEDDDLEAALEELGKEFEIVEIVWPDEDEEDEDDEEEEDDGSDSMNDEVDFDGNGEGDGQEEKEAKKEELTLGQRFAKRLTELKWSGDEDHEYARAKSQEMSDAVPDEDQEPEAFKPKAPEGLESSWNVEKDEKGMTISNDRFSISLDDDETMDLLNKIADKQIARFKNEHGKVVYVFSPRGREYILKTPEYQGGFRIPTKVIDQMLDK